MARAPCHHGDTRVGLFVLLLIIYGRLPATLPVTYQVVTLG